MYGGGYPPPQANNWAPPPGVPAHAPPQGQGYGAPGSYPPPQGYAAPPGGYPPPQGYGAPAPGGYPPPQGYGVPPGGYPPPQQYGQPAPGAYPPQQGYPPQPAPGGYPPPQQGYAQPVPGGYPGGYPPQQPGYPPQQQGYPPPTHGAPPQQGGYPPPQGAAPGGYPPQGAAPGGYPPHGAPPAGQPGYPPQQPGYPPQQPGYPPQQPGQPYNPMGHGQAPPATPALPQAPPSRYPVSTYPVCPVPYNRPAPSPQQLKTWSADCRRAMKGLGTNEKLLIETLCPRTNEEIQMIRRQFQQDHSRDLLKDVRSETSGNFEEALTSVIMERYEYDAFLVEKACKGLGTNEDLLAEVLCTKSPAELKLISEAYQRQFGKSMEQRVYSELSGDLKLIYQTILGQNGRAGPVKDDNYCDNDVKTLFAAGEGRWGTNEKAFINVICNNPRQYCEKLFYAYANSRGKSLDRAIKNEMAGDVGKALMWLVTPLEISYANKFYESMKGLGTSDSNLIRLVAVNKQRGLREVNNRFLSDHQKNLQRWVKDETSGDYRDTLTKTLESFC